MKLWEKKLGGSELFRGKIVKLELDEAELPDGKVVKREVVRHPGGVCIAAVDDRRRVYMVEQYRYPFGETVLELPAGKLEYGEDPDKAAERELMEETGCRAGRLTKLGVSYSSPGFCDEVIHLYLAEDLSVGEQALDEGEFLDLLLLDLDEATQMAADDRIKDGKSKLLLLLAEKRL